MQDFVQFAERLAQASGEVIKQYFRAELVVDSKGDGTPVTIADKKSEMVMREMIQKEFPQHGILGEEFDDYQADAEYQWILDPIDGTKTFVAGVPLFGTLIGLLKNGKPILGVINNPIIDQFLIGANGVTRLNGKKVQVRLCDSIEAATVLCTSHWSVEKYHDMVAYEKLTRRAKLYRSWGDCYGYYLVATGYADVMLDPAMYPWDLIPLVPIIEGAGGTITDWYGNDPINGQGAVATTGGIHDEVIRALNP
jgi:histidinol phosphatase-like enzyme (inositol monophosphatase family)